MTDKINDGGPAFPTDALPSGGRAGMTLRDWFAGQALAGICGWRNDFVAWPSAGARKAYEMADAMLKAREDRS